MDALQYDHDYNIIKNFYIKIFINECEIDLYRYHHVLSDRERQLNKTIIYGHSVIIFDDLIRIKSVKDEKSVLLYDPKFLVRYLGSPDVIGVEV